MSVVSAVVSPGRLANVDPVRLLAPAKLTLSLRVTGTRADGYHLIDAEMVSLDLCDELVVHPSAHRSVEIVPAPRAGGQVDSQQVWDIPTDGSNLVIKALELAGRTAHVEIRKRIPPGAGLGGGSADAAAVLRWANQITASERLLLRAASEVNEISASASSDDSGNSLTRLDESSLIGSQQAATLGADVAFCLIGGRARVTGIGEIVKPLPFRVQSFVLSIPPIHVDTATVYRMWDELGGPVGPNANDLESAAVAAYPELSAWRDDLEAATGRTPQLAGSGGTWFVSGPIDTNTESLNPPHPSPLNPTQPRRQQKTRQR